MCWSISSYHYNTVYPGELIAYGNIRYCDTVLYEIINMQWVVFR